MKAAVFTRYGGPEVVSILEQPKPAVGPKDVLIRTHATTVNSGDSRIRGMRVPAGFVPMVRLMFGIFGPRRSSQVLGSSLAGEIVEVGELDPDEIHLPGIYVNRLIQGTFAKDIEQRTVRSA